jgi:hypothetical protein
MQGYKLVLIAVCSLLIYIPAALGPAASAPPWGPPPPSSYLLPRPLLSLVRHDSNYGRSCLSCLRYASMSSVLAIPILQRKRSLLSALRWQLCVVLRSQKKLSEMIRQVVAAVAP